MHSTVRAGLAGTGLLQSANIGTISASGATPTLAQLRSYDVVLVWTNSSFSDPVATGNVLADYVDAGGRVVMATYAFGNSGGNSWWIGGRFMDPGYSPFLVSTSRQSVSGSLNLATAPPGHPIFDGLTQVTYFQNSNYTDPPLNTDATLLARDTQGNKVVAVNATGSVVAISIFPGNSNISTSNIGVSRLFANALLFAADRSNDGPLAVSPSLVSFGDVATGNSAFDTVFVANTGAQQVTISSLSITGANADHFTSITPISPSSQILGIGATLAFPIRFSPTSGGFKSALFNISHDAPESPESVILTGRGVGPEPVFDVSSRTKDFGHIPVGTSALDSVLVANTGHASLEISGLSITGANADQFESLQFISGNSIMVGVGGSLPLPARFAPTSPGFKYALFNIFHNAPGSPDSVVLSGVGFPVQQDSGDVVLALNRAFGAPGDTVLVHLVLKNPFQKPVGGIQAEVLRDRFHNVSFVGFRDALMVDGFSVDATSYEDTTVVLVYTTGRQILPSDTTRTLATLVFSLSDSIPYGPLTLRFGFTGVSDTLGNPLSHLSLNTILYVGLRGDVDDNQRINIFDVVKLVGFILDRLPTPADSTYEFFLADANADRSLDIMDIIRQVNVILRKSTKPVPLPGGATLAGLDEVVVLPDGRTAIPLRFVSPMPVAGLQASIMFNSERLDFQPPIPSGITTNTQIEWHINDGRMTIVLFDPQGNPLAPDQAGTVLLPFRSLSEGSEASLQQLILVDPGAGRIPVSVTQTVVRIGVSPIPLQFSLSHARPNPFNPSTRIAYDVPQQTHVTLIIYNLLGQEVMRLVDTVKAPGHHATFWDGRNAHGQAVASGVYVYRMTTGAGFSETRRMTLLK